MNAGAVHPGLARLAVRRALPWSIVALLTVVGALAALRDWGLPPDVPGAAGIARGLVRQGVWTLLVLVVVPLLVHRAARTPLEWREAEADWLASRPGGGRGLLLSTFLTLWLVALGLLTAAGLLAEVAVGEAGPTHRPLAAVANPAAVLFEGDPPHRWTAPESAPTDLPPGTMLRVELTVAPGSGPTVTTRVTAGGGAATGPIFNRRSLQVPLPTSATGPLVLEVERMSGGAILVLPANAIDLLEPVANDRWASVAVLARLALAAAAWIALGLGLGAWMRPGLATCLVFALWLGPWWWGGGATWIPGGDLPRVWSLLGQGLAPPGPTPLAPYVAGFLVLFGGGLARRGIRRGRSV